MTFAYPCIRKTLLGLACLSLALPIWAGDRNHAVRPLPDVTISGIITDSKTAAPIVGATVINGARTSSPTGNDGRYTLKVPGGRSTTITAQHFAHDPITRDIVPSEGMTSNFGLVSRDFVRVELVSGEVKELDLGTSQFAYLIPFSGYVRSNDFNLCRADGSKFSPLKTEFASIDGPAHTATSAACCNLAGNQILETTATLKSGEKVDFFFTDSCYGNEVDFVGRNRTSGVFEYFNFTTISKITFSPTN